MASKQQSQLQIGLKGAQQDIRGAAKDGTNSFHRYEYTTAETMIQVARDALHRHNLCCRVGTFEPTIVGGQLYIKQQMTVSHPGSDEHMHDTVFWPVVSTNKQPPDKAQAAAMTTSLAYWLRGLLMIPRGLPEGEVDQRDDTGYWPNQPDAPPAKPSKPKRSRKSSPRTAPTPAPSEPEEGPSDEQIDAAASFAHSMSKATTADSLYELGNCVRRADLTSGQKQSLRKLFAARLAQLEKEGQP